MRSELSAKLSSLPVLVSSLLFCFPFASPASAHCASISAGESFWVRLIDPVASYSSKPGTLVRAVLTQSPKCDAVPVFPVGIEVDGRVVSVRKVGLGLLHDIAKLEIQFERMVTPDGGLAISSQVVEVDNARETVRHGIIRGVRSTDTPQGRITSGLIHLPTANPYGDIALIVYRAVTPLPEPEIYLPPGTDLRLQLSAPLQVSDQLEVPQFSPPLDEIERGEIESLLQNVPERTTTSSGQNADLVNLLLVGSQDQVELAFAAAGWLPTDRNSYHAYLREFWAFLNFSNYSTMPVSLQRLDGRAPDSIWQKSLNSYSRREHIRVWGQPVSILSQQAWLGAYTRETSAALSIRYHKFIHHIDPDLDQGVHMLVRDLMFPGCVESVKMLPRSDLPRILANSTGDTMRTNGGLTVVHLRDCHRREGNYDVPPAIPIHPHSRMVRYFRNRMLLYRSDLIRGNNIYGMLEIFRVSLRSVRHNNRSPDDSLLPPVQSSDDDRNRRSDIGASDWSADHFIPIRSIRGEVTNKHEAIGCISFCFAAPRFEQELF